MNFCLMALSCILHWFVSVSWASQLKGHIRGENVREKAFGNLLCTLFTVKVVCILWLFYASAEQE